MLNVGRYTDADTQKSWQGWIEPEDRSWIAFIRADGMPAVYLHRDPNTGAVLQLTDAPDDKEEAGWPT